MASARIPDPFIGDNEKRVRWVAEEDWVYKRSFGCSPDVLAQDKVWLVCDGLDTLATITINGQEIGRADNMFRQYRWDVKSLLKARSLAFEEIKIDDEEQRLAFYEKCGPAVRQMPQVFINDQRVGGVAGLQAAFAQLKL